jgi:hypothetical protein
MLKKTVKYVDYDGTPREEDLFFHLTKAEIISMESETSDGFINDFQRSLASGDNRGIFRGLTFLIKRSYGERDELTQKFAKVRYNQPLYEDFIVSEAYSALIDGFLEKPDTIADFMNGVLPQEALAAAKKQIEESSLPE